MTGPESKAARIRRAEQAIGLRRGNPLRSGGGGEFQVPGLGPGAARYARFLAEYIAVWGHEPHPTAWNGQRLKAAEREAVRQRVRKDLIAAGFRITDTRVGG
jgi:hypothetical protein